MLDVLTVSKDTGTAVYENHFKGLSPVLAIYYFNKGVVVGDFWEQCFLHNLTYLMVCMFRY
jgi:hypothetical protein